MGKVDQEVSEALYQLENLIVYQEALGAQPLSSATMIRGSISRNSNGISKEGMALARHTTMEEVGEAEEVTLPRLLLQHILF